MNLPVSVWVYIMFLMEMYSDRVPFPYTIRTQSRDMVDVCFKSVYLILIQSDPFSMYTLGVV